MDDILKRRKIVHTKSIIKVKLLTSFICARNEKAVCNTFARCIYMTNIYFIELLCENKSMPEYMYINQFMCSTAAASAFAATITMLASRRPTKKAEKYSMHPVSLVVCVCV